MSESSNCINANSITPATIQAAIARYAEAYSALQELQERSELIPIGDQKTGVIAEFYVRLYLGALYPDAHVKFGSHSESGWDIEVRRMENAPMRIQVKCVSAYSTTRRISPICSGWHALYLVTLDRAFLPTGFWIIDDAAILEQGPLKHCSAPDPTSKRLGSAKLKLGPNRIAEFLALVEPQIRSGLPG